MRGFKSSWAQCGALSGSNNLTRCEWKSSVLNERVWPGRGYFDAIWTSSSATKMLHVTVFWLQKCNVLKYKTVLSCMWHRQTQNGSRALSHNPGVNFRCPIMFHIYCLVNLLDVHNLGCASFSHEQASNYHNIHITRKALKSTWALSVSLICLSFL